MRFRLKGMSPRINNIFSNLPTPLFVGLPGFCAKFWCLDSSNDDFNGLYKWKSQSFAELYSSSYSMDFMLKRSIPGSTSFEILPYKNNKYEIYPDLL